jgi:hypothetical protein
LKILDHCFVKSADLRVERASDTAANRDRAAKNERGSIPRKLQKDFSQNQAFVCPLCVSFAFLIGKKGGRYYDWHVQRTGGQGSSIKVAGDIRGKFPKQLRQLVSQRCSSKDRAACRYQLN